MPRHKKDALLEGVPVSEEETTVEVLTLEITEAPTRKDKKSEGKVHSITESYVFIETPSGVIFRYPKSEYDGVKIGDTVRL